MAIAVFVVVRYAFAGELLAVDVFRDVLGHIASGGTTPVVDLFDLEAGVRLVAPAVIKLLR